MPLKKTPSFNISFEICSFKREILGFFFCDGAIIWIIEVTINLKSMPCLEESNLSHLDLQENQSEW